MMADLRLNDGIIDSETLTKKLIEACNADSLRMNEQLLKLMMESQELAWNITQRLQDQIKDHINKHGNKNGHTR